MGDQVLVIDPRRQDSQAVFNHDTSNRQTTEILRHVTLRSRMNSQDEPSRVALTCGDAIAFGYVSVRFHTVRLGLSGVVAGQIGGESGSLDVDTEPPPDPVL